jgi:hypothetical protein
MKNGSNVIIWRYTDFKVRHKNNVKQKPHTKEPTRVRSTVVQVHFVLQ